MNRPPIDPDFYAIGAESGMSDAEIQADWDAYCDDLEKFHQELEAAAQKTTPEQKEVLKGYLANIQKELDAMPLPVQYGMQPVLDQIKNLFKEPLK